MKKMTNNDTLLFAAALCTGLIAGLFYAYSCSVNIALGSLTDIEYIRAMQAINRDIQNPLFFLSFMGTLVLLPLSAWMNYGMHPPARFYFLVAAAIVYTVGVFGVTMAGNVPLNETLAKFDVGSATASQITQFKQAFQKPWLYFHGIRAVLSVVSLAMVILACLCNRVNS